MAYLPSVAPVKDVVYTPAMRNNKRIKLIQGKQMVEDEKCSQRDLYGYRTDKKKPLVTYRFLNLSSFLDLTPGVFIYAISSRC